MVNESNYIKKLEEIVKAKKADNSILNKITNNKEEIKKLQPKIEELDKMIVELQFILAEKKQIRRCTPIFKVKEYIGISKDFSLTREFYRSKIEEKTNLEEYCKEKEKENEEIIAEIEKQYVIFQENEIFIKAVEKLSSSNIELSGEFYSKYLTHANGYLNEVYSIEKETKLTEPNIEDLAAVLELLKKHEDKLNAKKKTTRKRTTKKAETASENGEEVVEKKTARKRTTKKVAEVSEEKSETKKTTTRKRTTKKVAENVDEKVEDKKEELVAVNANVTNA